MKTKAFKVLWDVLSEVPGWPDAPRSLRVRRLVPIILPCVAALGLATWYLAVVQPTHDAERRAHAHLVALEQEIAALRLACSEQSATELASQVNEAGATLLDSSQSVATEVAVLQEKISSLGWKSTVQLYDEGIQGSDQDAVFGISPALVRLGPAADNAKPFPTLLATLDTISPADRRIEITRLLAGVDSEGRLSVELNLRLAHRIAHEEAAQ